MRVCIIGSGLSALTLAKAFVNQKIHVDFIDKNNRTLLSKSRTLGISKNNIKYFNKNIINIEKIIWKLKKIEIFTENLGNNKLLKFENNSDFVFSIVKNYKLYNLLKKNLKKEKYFKKIKLKKNCNLQKKYNLVINTEYNNLITKKYFNKKITKEYNSLAFTTIIKHEKILNNVAVQIFTKEGPLAFLPISNKETSIVYSINKNSKINVNDINKLIHHYNFKYRIKKIANVNNFELKSISLRTYYYKNILAFGDLLHKVHPLAGQGFNMTIRDIKNLIDIINDKIDLGLPLDKSVNEQFEKKVKNKNFIFLNGIDLLHEFFQIERKTNKSILSKSIQILGKNSSLNKMLINVADKGLNF